MVLMILILVLVVFLRRPPCSVEVRCCVLLSVVFSEVFLRMVWDNVGSFDVVRFNL